MTRKYFVLSLLLLALVVFQISACGPAAPTPDPSIVWADDFEDGDTEGWMVDDYGKLSVNEGSLAFTLETDNPDGIFYHESKVFVGTWSFDLLYPADVTPNYWIGLVYYRALDFGYGIQIYTSGDTFVAFYTTLNYRTSPGKSTKLNGILTGWNHVDITRDDSGNARLYLNGELILENKDELTFSPELFGIYTDRSGPTLDNLVVRNQVVDIQP